MSEQKEQPVVDEFSDNGLIVRYQNGDEDAFHELVNRYKNVLYPFLRRFLNRLEVVEDIFQETFLQLYVSRDSFDTNRPLLTSKGLNYVF